MAVRQGMIADEKEAVPGFTVAMGLLIMAAVFTLLAVRKHAFETICWTRVEIGANVLVGIGLWVGIMILSLMFIMMLGLFWPSAFNDFTQARTRIEEVFPRISIPIILLMSLATGVYEEVLFRGYLLTRLGQLFGSPVAAAVVSSLLFGSLHIYEGYAAVIIITIFGLVLAVCTLWRRSLVAAMVAHFLFNTFQLIMLYLISETWD